MVMVDGRSFMMGQLYSISDVSHGLSLLTFKGSVFCFRDSISQFFCLSIGLVCKLVTLLSISLLHVYSKALGCTKPEMDLLMRMRICNLNSASVED